MKKTYTIAALAALTVGANAALVASKSYTTNGTDYTGQLDGALLWGMDVNPINNVANVDVDGNGVKDFHESAATNVDPIDGKASNTDGGLFRWDYGGSPARDAGLTTGTGIDYTFEIGLNVLGTGTEGSRGVFGVALGFGSEGSMQFEIGEDSISWGSGGTDTTGLDAAYATASNLGEHTWRFAFDSTAAEFYVFKDGTLINDGGLGIGHADVANSGNSGLIGGYSGGLGGDWELDYIALDATGAYSAVPEPSSTALLGLGGLALILRRRK